MTLTGPKRFGPQKAETTDSLDVLRKDFSLYDDVYTLQKETGGGFCFPIDRYECHTGVLSRLRERTGN